MTVQPPQSADAIDPYVELGVDPKASDKEVRKAFRKRAKKTHPDNQDGGDRDAYIRATKALAILIDPDKRARFDRGESPDRQDVRKEAMRIVSAEIGKLVTQFAGSGFKPDHDPRKINVIDIVCEGLRSELAKKRALLAHGEKFITFLLDFEKRFTGGPPDELLQIMFAEHKRQHRASTLSLHRDIETQLVAIDICEQYQFRMDDPWDTSIGRQLEAMIGKPR